MVFLPEGLYPFLPFTFYSKEKEDAAPHIFQTLTNVLTLYAMENIKILDCTLRDGGYYNNWDFDQDLVQEYLTAMSESNIDRVEIGLRSFVSGKYYGPFFYTTDDFLNEINIPKDLCVGVMINAKEFIKK